MNGDDWSEERPTLPGAYHLHGWVAENAKRCFPRLGNFIALVSSEGAVILSPLQGDPVECTTPTGWWKPLTLPELPAGAPK